MKILLTLLLSILVFGGEVYAADTVKIAAINNNDNMIHNNPSTPSEANDTRSKNHNEKTHKRKKVKKNIPADNAPEHNPNMYKNTTIDPDGNKVDRTTNSRTIKNPDGTFNSTTTSPRTGGLKHHPNNTGMSGGATGGVSLGGN